MNSRNAKLEVLNDPDFKELSSKKNSISITLTVLELIAYFGFIFLIAFNKEFLAQDISPSITIGIPIGIGVIVFSWVLTGIYVRWANSKYDALVEKVKDKIGG
ncbi:MAG TPA: DUF485 domain-containing protein [Nitrospirota bacterium]|nr:DUF485 domain-containing protein [Nitrospirota bacterium]